MCCVVGAWRVGVYACLGWVARVVVNFCRAHACGCVGGVVMCGCVGGVVMCGCMVLML